jgi:hypothetical protein
MSDYDRGHGSPLKLVGALVVVGLLGRRGQGLLSAIRSVAKWSLALSVLAMIAAYVIDDRRGVPLLIGGAIGALVSTFIWGYAAFAQWLTRQNDAEDE